jgi:RNA polymerase sigma-70 factor (ECF subfamily)
VDYSAHTSERLVSACCEPANEPAWAEFIRRFQSLVAKTVLRTARRWNATSPVLLDDLVQETYVKLCANDCRLLREFEPRSPDSFYGYLKVLTSNVVHDHFKAGLAAKRGAGVEAHSIGGEGTEGEVSIANPGHRNLLDAERMVLLREIDQQLVQLLPPEDLQRSRLVFWLYYRSGMSANAIASLPQIHLTTKGVESLLFRLTQQVKSILSRPSKTDKAGKDADPDRKGFRQAESF